MKKDNFNELLYLASAILIMFFVALIIIAIMFFKGKI